MEDGIKAFWGIESVGAFTRMVRTSKEEVQTHGQKTADFCTMYTSLPFATIINNVKDSIQEAYEHERSVNRPLEVD